MIRIAAVLAAALAATACSTREAPPPVAMMSGPDTCGAANLQAAVGQPASIMPTNLQALRIVDVKQGEPTAEAPARVTVINDIQEQRIRAVRCG